MNANLNRINAIRHYFESKPILVSYGLAGFAILFAVLMISYEPTINQVSPLIILFLAVLVCSLLLSDKPAILATVIILLLGNSLFFSKTNVLDAKSLWVIEIDILLMFAALLIASNHFNRKIYIGLLQKQQDLARAQILGEIGNWRLVLSTNELLWSEQNYLIFGIRPGTPLTYESFLECVHPDDRDYVNRSWQAAVLHQAHYDIDHRIIAGGKIKWIRERVQLEFDPAGKLLGGFGTAQDISDRKAIELALEESREKYASIVQSVLDVIITTDENARILVFNKAAEQLFGCKASEAVGDNIDRFIPERYRKSCELKFISFCRSGDNVYRKGKSLTMTGLKASGVEFPLTATLLRSSLGEKKTLTIILRDLTDRLASEKAISDQLRLQDQLVKVAASAPGIIATFRMLPDGRMMMPYASPAIETVYGLAADSVAEDAAPIMERIHPDDVSSLIESINVSARTMQPWHHVYRYLHPVTGEKWIEGHSIPQKENDGSISWHGYLQDVTDRQLSEAALALRERQLNLIMDATPALISYVTVDLRYVLINKTYENWFCLHSDQILGHGIKEIVGQKAWAIVKPWLERAQAGERVSFDYQIPYGSGRPRWVQASYIPDKDENQQVKGIVIHVVDVEDRVNAKMQIDKLNMQLRYHLEEMDRIFDTVPVGLAISYDLNNAKNIRGNRTLEKMLGLPHGSELSKTNSSAPNYTVLDKSGRPVKVEELPMQRAVRGGIVSEQVLTVYSENGKAELLANAMPLLNENGQPRGAIGAFLDISRLVAIEKSLQKSQDQLRLLIEQAPVSLAMFDKDMNYLVTSRMWLENFGKGRDSFVGLNHYTLFPNLPQRWKEAHRQALAGSYLSAEKDLWSKADGSRHWQRWAIQPWSNEEGVIGGIIIAAEDVTERYLAQEALQASEEFRRDVLNSLPARIAVLDSRGIITAVNEPWDQFAVERSDKLNAVECLSVGADYLGVCRKSVKSGDPYAKQALDGLEALIAGKRDFFILEYPCLLPEGEQWYLLQAKRMNTKSPYLIVAHFDITELKSAQEALHESQTQLGMVMAEVNAGYWYYNLFNKVFFVSPEWKRQLGIEEHEIIDSLALWEERLHPDDRDAVLQNTQQFLHERQSLYEMEYRMLHTDGNFRWIHSRGVLLRDTNNRPYRLLGMNLDVTDYKNGCQLKEQQDEMEQSFRFYVAGQTAAAIAHELNQPLTAISYYSDAAQAILESGRENSGELAQVLEKCNQQVLRAGSVMRQLLALLQKGEVVSEIIDLNKSIKDIQPMLKSDSRSQRYEIIFELNENLPPIQSSFLLVQKVLINLINNSMEAMQSSGLESGSIRVTSRRYNKAKDMAEVIVQDSGKGVADADDLKKMFQPFFTTKKDGLGVGLAICRALIEAHNGDMWAEQNVGHGLSMHFTLPFAA